MCWIQKAGRDLWLLDVAQNGGKRWVVQGIKHQLRAYALWALLCPCYPGTIVAESLQGLIFVDIHQNW